MSLSTLGMRGAEAPHGKASCQAIAVNGSGPWVDHFVAGAAHLVRCAGVGGFYMDGIAFNRDAMKRMRRAAERGDGRAREPACCVHALSMPLIR